MNPGTVWDLPYDLWLIYAQAHDERVHQEEGDGDD